MALRVSRSAVGLACPLLLPLTAWAGVTVDGQNIPTDFSNGQLLASQRWQTGFGDDTSGDQFGFGSELDQFLADNDDTYLYLGLSGNLENNGNSGMIFIDVDGPGSGANLLRTQDFGVPVAGLPRYLAGNVGEPGLNNLAFDDGFAPDFVIGWTGGSPIGSQTRTYYLVNWTELDPVSGGTGHTNTILGLMTAGNPTASGPAGTLGAFLGSTSLGVRAAADNSNDFGVEGAFPPGEAANDPATATRGFEFAIPLSLLGVGVGDEVCLMALVSSPNGFMSNQLLPTDSNPARTTFSNLGFPPVDLGNDTVAFGDQFVCYTVVGGCPNDPQGRCARSDLNGDCLVDLGDLAILLAGWGNPFELEDLALLLSDWGTDCN